MYAQKRVCQKQIRSSSFLLIFFCFYSCFLAQYIDAFNIVVISKRISCLKYARIYVSEPDSNILRKRSKYLAQKKISVVIFFYILTVAV